MATFQELMDRLAEQRARASEGSPIATVLDNTSKNMQMVASAVQQLHTSVEKQVAANLAARKAGEAQDVQQTIKNMLQAKLAEDKIEHERHQRMMDMAEKLVPQVTDEQIKAVHEQVKTYRNFTKATELRIKEVEQQRAEANFAIKDKFGTIESALGGLANSGGDSLGKFLVNGISRFVKEKKETPASEAVKEKFDEEVFWRKEAASVVAAREHITDPGSAAKLFTERDAKVKSLAGEGEAFEKQLLAGKVKVSVPNFDKGAKEIATAISNRSSQPKELPVISKSKIEDFEKPLTANKPDKANKPKSVSPTAAKKGATPNNPNVASTLRAKPARAPAPTVAVAPPANARFVKAGVQATAPVTPAVAKAAPAVATTAATAATTAASGAAAVGKLGSKVGAVNLAGIGTALGGIASKLGSLAGSALKFLGPWGLVAAALMSLDRLVPIFSSMAGATMDLTKLIMPLVVSSILELSAQAMGGLNGLINLFDHARLIGPHWTEEASTKEAVKKAQEKEAEAQSKRQAAKMAAEHGSVTLDTTSAQAGVGAIGKAGIYKRESVLTSPAEAAAVTAQANDARAAVQQNYALDDWKQEQSKQNEAMRQAVKEAASAPGSAVYMKSNPYLEPIPA